MVVRYKIEELQYLVIGQQGETNANIIEIDMESWVEELAEQGYENPCCHVLFKPYNQTVPLETGSWNPTTGILTWEVTTAFTAIAGQGYTEIRAFNHPDNGLVKKSKVIPTEVNASVSGVEGGIPPAPYDDWLNQFLQLEDRLNNALSHTTLYYAISDTATDMPSDDEFDEEMPDFSLNKGKYLWTRTDISWSTGSISKLYTVAYLAQDGSGAVNSVNGLTGSVILDGGNLYTDITAAVSSRMTLNEAINSKLDSAKIVYDTTDIGPSNPTLGMIWLKPKAVS